MLFFFYFLFFQGIAQRYCVDCKNAFEEMSKVTQSVTATRQELAKYDAQQQETLSQVFKVSPSASPSTVGNRPSFSRLPSWSSYVENPSRDPESNCQVVSKCFGCTLSCIQHCLTILRALVTLDSTHSLMLKEVGIYKR